MNDLTNYHRVFLAIPVEDDLQNYIHQTITNMYPSHIPARWIREENYHITLHYLGSVTENQLQSIRNKIRPLIENYASFSLKLEVVSCFPSVHKPHSLAILVKLSFLLNSLYEEMKTIIESCDIAVPSHTYNPHLTIARIIKKGMWVGSSKRLPSPLKISVQKISLLQSLTDEHQIQFHKLDSFALNHHRIPA